MSGCNESSSKKRTKSTLKDFRELKKDNSSPEKRLLNWWNFWSIGQTWCQINANPSDDLISRHSRSSNTVYQRLKLIHNSRASPWIVMRLSWVYTWCDCKTLLQCNTKFTSSACLCAFLCGITIHQGLADGPNMTFNGYPWVQASWNPILCCSLYRSDHLSPVLHTLEALLSVTVVSVRITISTGTKKRVLHDFHTNWWQWRENRMLVLCS